MILKFESHDGPPDPKVKAALEELLPVTDRDGFRAAVLSRASGMRVRSVTTLDRWARPALAAAAAIALVAWVAGGLLDQTPVETPTWDTAMVSSATGSTPAAFIAAPRPPDPETVFGSLGTP